MKIYSLIFGLFLSFSALAEYRVVVKNLQDEQTHKGEFATLELAQAWITEQESDGSWGLGERLKETSLCSQEELASALEIIPATELSPEMARLPKQYQVVGPTDITIEVQTRQAAEYLIAQGAKAKADCDKVLNLVRGSNIGRPSSDVDSMVTTFAVALDHLEKGRPGKAKHAIQQIVVDGVLVTQAMKDLALAQLSDWEPVE